MDEIRDGNILLDGAFRKAGKISIKKVRNPDLIKARAACDFLIRSLGEIGEWRLSDFERELISTLVDIDLVRTEIRRARNSAMIIKKLENKYGLEIKYAARPEARRLRTELYGRLASIMKRIELREFKKYKNEIKKLPKLRDVKTIIICGAPNVGKSEILRGLSGSKVEVAPYPFTTKNILIGYMKHRYEDIQLIDTPGLLDRSFEERNEIEKRAILALKYISNKILFVLDASEACGYSLESQLNLLRDVKKQFNPDVFLIATKADLPGKKVSVDMKINALDAADIEKLRAAIIERFC